MWTLAWWQNHLWLASRLRDSDWAFLGQIGLFQHIPWCTTKRTNTAFSQDVPVSYFTLPGNLQALYHYADVICGVQPCCLGLHPPSCHATFWPGSQCWLNINPLATSFYCHLVMRMEFSYTWKMTIFTFLCILALSTAYSWTGYASTQGYTSTTLAPSNVILPRDWSLFL